MQYFTDFADQGVMLPVAAVISASLALMRWWRGLIAWLLAFAGVSSAMALLKFLAFTCNGLFGIGGIHSPSGHTASATAIYGGVLILLLRQQLPGLALASIPPVIAVLFGTSRLVLHAHDLPEVVIGAGVGLVGAASVLFLAGRRPQCSIRPIALACCLVMAACHGYHVRAEGSIHRFFLFTMLPLPSSCHGWNDGADTRLASMFWADVTRSNALPQSLE